MLYFNNIFRYFINNNWVPYNRLHVGKKKCVKYLFIHKERGVFSHICVRWTLHRHKFAHSILLSEPTLFAVKPIRTSVDQSKSAEILINFHSITQSVFKCKTCTSSFRTKVLLLLNRQFRNILVRVCGLQTLSKNNNFVLKAF